MSKDFSQLASEESINKSKAALEKNGVEVFVVENGSQAKEKVLALIPKGAEVMTMSSETLRLTGIAEHINTSGEYASVRKRFETMDRKTQNLEMQKIGAAPEWAIGSVHAVTEKGEVLIASGSGSQLPAYAYGSPHVLWVVGAQKLVKDFSEGLERLYNYCQPLENERTEKTRGFSSSVNKILVINSELQANRLKMVIIKEKIGF